MLLILHFGRQALLFHFLDQKRPYNRASDGGGRSTRKEQFLVANEGKK